MKARVPDPEQVPAALRDGYQVVLEGEDVVYLSTEVVLRPREFERLYPAFQTLIRRDYGRFLSDRGAGRPRRYDYDELRAAVKKFGAVAGAAAALQVSRAAIYRALNEETESRSSAYKITKRRRVRPATSRSVTGRRRLCLSLSCPRRRASSANSPARR
jgi:hypothetical protein